MTVVLIGREKAKTDNQECHMTAEAAIEIIWPQIKNINDYQQMPQTRGETFSGFSF